MATSKIPLLVADDDLSFRTGVQEIAHGFGFDPFCISTHSEAAIRIKHELFAFAIIELRLADGFAFDLLGGLRQRNPEASVVIATRYPSMAAAVAAIREGARAFIVKPVKPASVLEALVGEAVPVLVQADPPMSLAKFEWEYIASVLVSCRGNISQAARQLGLHRQSLQRKLSKFPPTH